MEWTLSPDSHLCKVMTLYSPLWTDFPRLCILCPCLNASQPQKQLTSWSRDYSHKIGKITFVESFGEFYGCRRNNTSTRTGKFSWELERFLCSQRNRITLLKSRRFLISLATAVVDMPIKFILWGGWISLKNVMAIHPISVETFHSTNQPTLPSLQTEIPKLFSLSLLFLIFLGRLENIMKQY